MKKNIKCIYCKQEIKLNIIGKFLQLFLKGKYLPLICDDCFEGKYFPRVGDNYNIDLK